MPASDALPSGPVDGPATVPAFDEALWPGAVGWLAVPFFAGTLAAALLPVDGVLAVVAGLVVLVGGLVALVVTTPRVRVVAGELHAGRAHVPVALLREPRALDAPTLRHELGPGLDARAFLCHRGWVRTAVRAELADPADPTPYWVVSTRRPEALVAALRAA
ncbi:DUF3093 family protein [Cellulomonas sp. DKR-3]|uniref:DUF3093 family protein n=1 Tax=Cellulomonas fulva TaxID=2835530 RepID=A0ABS5U0G3_9CELL|nr:DUF3093 domain-containing protein [Cellulomonas fulva]MBT0994897.1 DUF3093 family protein [Cellulomonas fulva]